MRILIVDDEEVLRDVLDAVLRREGFEIVPAASGEEALSVLDGDENIDLVILDIMLPGISGIDTLRAIRIANPNLPVIVITAFSSIDGAIEAMKHGAFHYIPKPFKTEAVVLTGAIATKRGLFEVADGGSIFLDEIGNINLETQAKLLRVIQEKEFMRLGSVETIKVDVRIVAASNADLHKLMAENRFREDLYYRLNVITIALPPLRRRRED